MEVSSASNPPPLSSSDFPPLTSHTPPPLTIPPPSSSATSAPATHSPPPTSSSQNTSVHKNLSHNPPSSAYSLWKDLFKRNSDLQKSFPPPSFTSEGVPVVRAPASILLKTSEAWKDHLICHFFGSPPPLRKIFSDLNRIWGKKGQIRVHYYSPRACLIFIPDAELREWVLDVGFWSAGTVSFAVSLWSPSPSLSEQSLTSAPVWLTLHDVPPQLCSEEGLAVVASGVGIPLPQLHSNGNPQLGFGPPKIRAVVRLDKGPLPQSVIIQDDEGAQVSVAVEYRNLPPLCSSCNCYGHKAHRCSIPSRKPSSAVSQPAAVESSSPATDLAPTSTSVPPPIAAVDSVQLPLDLGLHNVGPPSSKPSGPVLGPTHSLPSKTSTLLPQKPKPITQKPSSPTPSAPKPAKPITNSTSPSRPTSSKKPTNSQIPLSGLQAHLYRGPLQNPSLAHSPQPPPIASPPAVSSPTSTASPLPPASEAPAPSTHPASCPSPSAASIGPTVDGPEVDSPTSDTSLPPHSPSTLPTTNAQIPIPLQLALQALQIEAPLQAHVAPPPTAPPMASSPDIDSHPAPDSSFTSLLLQQIEDRSSKPVSSQPSSDQRTDGVEDAGGLEEGEAREACLEPIHSPELDPTIETKKSRKKSKKKKASKPPLPITKRLF